MVCARTGKCPSIDPQRLPPGLLHQQSITVDVAASGELPGQLAADAGLAR
jgi:hypothetical protein